jgi:hypothetical protein
MLKVVQGAAASGDDTAAGGSSLLDEIVRDGARQMLAVALQAEIAAYIEAHADALDGVVTCWWSATATRPPGGDHGGRRGGRVGQRRSRRLVRLRR